MAASLTVSASTASQFLAVGILTVAGVLAWRQIRDQRRRALEAPLSEADVRHFARQDFRRFVVGAVMVLLALGVAVGTRLAPRLAGRANVWFLAVWLGVFLLILVLLWLALLDWLATWVYARRTRRELAREHRELLQAERSARRSAGGNGQGNPYDSSNGPLPH